MKFIYPIFALTLAMSTAMPAFAQTAMQNAEHGAAGAGGSAGSINSSPTKPTTPSNTERAKREAVDNHSGARAAANAGEQ
jgi:hypothetical protein